MVALKLNVMINNNPNLIDAIHESVNHPLTKQQTTHIPLLLYTI